MNVMFESQLWSLCVSNGGTIYICISGVYYMRCLTGLHARSVLVCCKTAIGSFNGIWLTLLLDFERSGAGKMKAMFESHLWSVCVSNGGNIYIRISSMLYMRCVYGLHALIVLVRFKTAIGSFSEIWLRCCWILRGRSLEYECDVWVTTVVALCKQWWNYLYTHLVHALYEMRVQLACPERARVLQNSNMKLQRDLAYVVAGFWEVGEYECDVWVTFVIRLCTQWW